MANLAQVYDLYRKFEYYFYRLKGLCFYKFLFEKFGNGSCIYPPILITPSCIRIGSKVGIRNNARIEGIKKYGSILYNPKIEICDNVRIEQNIHLTCANHIFIGMNTSIASNVTITDINHSYIDINIPVEMQDLEVKSVYIGCDSKIYNNAVVLPGVKIGNHCIIGANTVVNIDIPDYSIAVGSPCKIVRKYNFNTQVWEKENSKN